MSRIAWACLALGFLALGADAYWSWKAQAWTFQPIGFYLALIDPALPGRLDGPAISGMPGAFAGFLRTVLIWPVWAPAFAFGAVLYAVIERAPPRSRQAAHRDERRPPKRQW